MEFIIQRRAAASVKFYEADVGSQRIPDIYSNQIRPPNLAQCSVNYTSLGICKDHPQSNQ